MPLLFSIVQKEYTIMIKYIKRRLRDRKSGQFRKAIVDWVLKEYNPIYGDSTLHQTTYLEHDLISGGDITKEFIWRAALQLPDNQIFSMDQPTHHAELIWAVVYLKLVDSKSSYKQGFVTNYGRYVGRHEALVIATANNQLKNHPGYELSQLFSEFMWRLSEVPKFQEIYQKYYPNKQKTL